MFDFINMSLLCSVRDKSIICLTHLISTNKHSLIFQPRLFGNYVCIQIICNHHYVLKETNWITFCCDVKRSMSVPIKSQVIDNVGYFIVFLQNIRSWDTLSTPNGYSNIQLFMVLFRHQQHLVKVRERSCSRTEKVPIFFLTLTKVLLLPKP